jgi:hypothetical protein
LPEKQVLPRDTHVLRRVGIANVKKHGHHVVVRDLYRRSHRSTVVSEVAAFGPDPRSVAEDLDRKAPSRNRTSSPER